MVMSVSASGRHFAQAQNLEHLPPVFVHQGHHTERALQVAKDRGLRVVAVAAKIDHQAVGLSSDPGLDAHLI